MFGESKRILDCPEINPDIDGWSSDKEMLARPKAALAFLVEYDLISWC